MVEDVDRGVNIKVSACVGHIFFRLKDGKSLLFFVLVDFKILKIAR